MIRFFVEPLLMIAGVGVTISLMYTGSVLYEKHKREDKE